MGPKEIWRQVLSSLEIDRDAIPAAHTFFQHLRVHVCD